MIGGLAQQAQRIGIDMLQGIRAGVTRLPVTGQLMRVRQPKGLVGLGERMVGSSEGKQAAFSELGNRNHGAGLVGLGERMAEGVARNPAAFTGLSDRQQRLSDLAAQMVASTANKQRAFKELDD